MLKAMINFRNYRWAARLSGFLAFVLIISFLAGQGLEIIGASSNQNATIYILALLAVSLLAYLAGWVVEIAGGVMLITSGVVLSIYLYTNQIFTHPVHFFNLTVSLIIPGIFYMLSWRHKILRIRKANGNRGV